MYCVLVDLPVLHDQMEIFPGLRHYHDVLNGIAIENQVHFFSDHFAAATAHGLALTEMHERVIDEEWVAAAEVFEKYLHQPVGFCMVWKLLS